MALPIYVVDAFTERPFAGNPAAVCLVDGALHEAAMQRVAAEMNLSETAFVRRATPVGGAGPGWLLRWFTPAAEVELCGHATLAAAHLLWELAVADLAAPITFDTRAAGVLTCRLVAEDSACPDGEVPAAGPRIAMDFPADPPVATEPPPGLVEALGVRPVAIARARYDWIVEVGSAGEVRTASPDFAALARIDTRGVAVTALDGSGPHDIVSRFFSPRMGIAEDPVTGSVHCALAPYYRKRLARDVIEAVQASPRGGRLRLRCLGDRVELTGQATTVLRGELVGDAATPVAGEPDR